jgi:hypothetical protein
MHERNEISVELSALSALVSGISRQTPYGAPVGYFDQFPATVMNRIAGSSLILQPGSSAILQTRSSAFEVPEGYFEGFAAQVLGRIRAGGTTGFEDHRTTGSEDELPPIFCRISRVTPYQVPDGYFEEQSPLLAVLRDKPAYSIPEGYFDELSPVLTVAHDRTTYRVPEGYFAELAERILERVVPNVAPNVFRPAAAAKVVPMGRVAAERVPGNDRISGGKVLKGHWWKYSSVAAIAACILLIFSWPQVSNKITVGAMTPDVSSALQKVTDQEMQAYLDDQHAILTEPVTNTTATLDLNEGDVKSLLGEVSDNDLQQYMEEHGKAEDLATN